MSFLEGQEFTVPQPAGVNVVAFVVNQTTFEKWDTLPLFMLEKLECVQREDEGKVLKTFSVPTEDEVPNVIILSLSKSRCVIGYGKISNSQFVPEGDTIHLQYTNMADVDGEEKEYTFRYNSKRQIVIIDAETGDQIVPKIYKSEVTQGFSGKYKLVPYKKYVALELAARFTTPSLKNNKPMSRMEQLANMKI